MWTIESSRYRSNRYGTLRILKSKFNSKVQKEEVNTTKQSDENITTSTSNVELIVNNSFQKDMGGEELFGIKDFYIDEYDDKSKGYVIRFLF